MPQTWIPHDGMTRRVIATISAALLAFALVLVLPTGPNAIADHGENDCGANVLFVLDQSGSMDSEGIDEVKEGLSAFAAALANGAAAGSHIGIVEFASGANRPLGNTWYDPTDATLTNYINGFSAESSPNYWTNWEAAMAEANTFTDGVTDKPDYVVLITDGQPTEYNPPKDAGNSLDEPSSHPEDDAEMWEFASWEAVNEYVALSGKIAGGNTILGFGAGSDFDGGDATTRLGRIVDTVTTVSPLSALGEAIAALADEICAPSIDLDKSSATTAISSPQVINYTFTITNNGNVNLTGVTLDDPMLSDESCDWDNSSDANTAEGVLSPDETVDCTGSYTATQGDINAGTDLDNTATADSNETESVDASHKVTITPPPEPDTPAIDVRKGPDNLVSDKGADSTTVLLGSDHTFWITVTNTGDVTLTNVTVVDAVTPACDRTSADIAALASMASGASVTYSCVTTNVTGPIENVAVASGTAPDESTPTDSDPSTVLVVAASAVIGDTVWYDTNDNGVQDGGELGIAGAKVRIENLDGADIFSETSVTSTQLTNADGKYLFSGLPAGNYKVHVIIGDVPNISQNAQRFTTASSFTIDLPEGGEYLTADFGVIADELPATGINTDTILLAAALLLVAGAGVVLASRRKNDGSETDLPA
jgi:uncharacterized repeat protein (TIGR01451 family)/LPXTG-motif cell wall-anchored protein